MENIIKWLTFFLVVIIVLLIATGEIEIVNFIY